MILGDRIMFVCKVCSAEHEAANDCTHTLKLPKTITTSRDRGQRWFFHCVGCVEQ